MTIYGWDMSHYDAPGIGNAVSSGIRFITHKAGGDANDSEIGQWWSGVKGLSPSECLLGAYWVLYPGNPTGRADQFIARLDATCPGWRDRPFILQVDCEKWGGDAGTVPGKADIKAFCDRLVAKMPKLRPIVYAPKWVYGDSLAGLQYPIWASNYVTGSGSFTGLYPGDASSRWNAYGGQTPAVLQYTSSATIGGQTTCDANAFRGTLAELTALLAPGWSSDTVELQDIKDIWSTDDIVESPSNAPSHADNPFWSPKSFLTDISQGWRSIKEQTNAIPGLVASIGALQAAVSALATGTGFSEEQLRQIVEDGAKAALREGTGE